MRLHIQSNSFSATILPPRTITNVSTPCRFQATLWKNTFLCQNIPLSYAFSRAIKLSGSTIWQMGSIEEKTMLCVHSSIPLRVTPWLTNAYWSFNNDHRFIFISNSLTLAQNYKWYWCDENTNSTQAKYLSGGKELDIIRGGHDGCRSHSPSVQLAAKRLYPDPNHASTIVPLPP